MKVTEEAGVLARSERFFATPARSRADCSTTSRAPGIITTMKIMISATTARSRISKATATSICSMCAPGRCASAPITNFRSSADRLRSWTAADLTAFSHTVTQKRSGCTSTERTRAHFSEQIIAFHGGRQVFTPAAALHLEQELAQLILGLRTGETSEVERSQALYRILCGLLLPQRAQSRRKRRSRAGCAFHRQPSDRGLPVRSIAAHVNLSTSHFSRIFRASTGFFAA